LPIATAPPEVVAAGSEIARLPHQCAEPLRVELTALDVKQVARWPRHDRVRAQHPAQLRDVGLHDLSGRRGRSLPPELVDQTLTRDDLVRMEQKHAEKRAELRSLDQGPMGAADELERPENPELHKALFPPGATVSSPR